LLVNTSRLEIGAPQDFKARRHPNGTLIETHTRRINGTDYLFIRLTRMSGSVTVMAQPLVFDETASWHTWGA
jgi:hypothetical protein